MSRHGYQIIETIGRGSYGEATLVKDREGKKCVMKTIDISKLDSGQQKDAGNEVKVLASLAHPYVVRYQESFVDNGTLAIVMDFAEGGDLEKRINRQSQLKQQFSEPVIHRWLAQMALGLKYLHKLCIIHRDLKPQNIFLTKKGDCRIGDFGISKMLGSKSAVKEQTIGTPYYLSPEICRDGLYSFASDIWALGVIVFQLASLRVPFEAQNVATLVKKITSGSRPQMPQSYSSELRQLVSCLLCHNHETRASAADIVQTPIIRVEMHRMLHEKHPESVPLLAMGRQQQSSDGLLNSGRPSTSDVENGSLPLSSRQQSGDNWRSSPRPGSNCGRRFLFDHRPPAQKLRQSAAMLMVPSASPRSESHDIPTAVRRAFSSGCGSREAWGNPSSSRLPSKEKVAAPSRPPSGRRKSTGGVSAFARGGG
jgi:NIMA (never in mitosis gene a)-related kinase